MRLYIVRHGQTLFNVKHRIQGWCDSFLTDVGIQQAKALGRGLQDVPFVAAYASTSERAIDTANYIIGERNIALTTKKELKEIHFGSLEGEYEKDWLADDGSTHDKGFVEYGGETLLMTQQRIVKSIQEIANKHPEGNVLVVSHGGAIMCSMLGLFHYDVEKFRSEGNHIKNASVSVISYENEKFTLESLSNIEYLEKGKRGLSDGI